MAYEATERPSLTTAKRKHRASHKETQAPKRRGGVHETPPLLPHVLVSCNGSSVKPRARLIWRLEIRCGRSQSARLHQATVSGCTDEECAVKKFGDRHNALIKRKSRPHNRSGSCAQRKTLRHHLSRGSQSPGSHTHNLAPRLPLVNHSSSSSSPPAKLDNVIAVLANSR